MNPSVSPWAIVLAAGDGTRLRALTVDEDGAAVPKQYCSLTGRRTLLGDALARARATVPADRIATIVAAKHRPFWQREFSGRPQALRDQLVVQPRNAGTAAGVLLPLLHILEQDRNATVALFASDHHVEQPDVLQGALERAFEATDDEPSSATLLGIMPDAPETEYGWIVPEPGVGPVRRVAHFVEKPPILVAERLCSGGGLWNSLLLVARAEALLDMIAARLPRLTYLFFRAFEAPKPARAAMIEHLYDEIEDADFSRDVLQGGEDDLRVLEVPPCGWTDLGTPHRVAECLQRRRFAPSLRRSSGRRPLVVFGHGAVSPPSAG